VGKRKKHIFTSNGSAAPQNDEISHYGASRLQLEGPINMKFGMKEQTMG